MLYLLTAVNIVLNFDIIRAYKLRNKTGRTPLACAPLWRSGWCV